MKKLKPIQSSPISKSEASFQFHMLDLMSQMVRQQKQTNVLLKKALNIPTQSHSKTSTQFYKQRPDTAPKDENYVPSGTRPQTWSSVKNRQDPINENKNDQKIDVVLNFFSDSLEKTDNTNKQILNQLKILNKNSVQPDNMNILLKQAMNVQNFTQNNQKLEDKHDTTVTNQKYYSRLEQIQPHADRREAKVKIDFHKIIEEYKQPIISTKNFEQSIKQWLGIVYRVTASISWNMLQNQLLSFNQTKILFTQNIIFNYIQFMKQIKFVKTQQMKIKQKKYLATSIVNKQSVQILKFLCTQYPQTKIQAPNMAIRNTIDYIDEKGDVKYDIVAYSKVSFRYNERNQYASDVMRFINYLIDTVEQKHQYFEDFFYKLFDNLHYPPESRKWPRDTIDVDINSEYKIKVKKYTKFAIGRKIPKNTLKYTKQQLDNGIFFLKSPTVGRILLKWIEELIQIVKNPKSAIQQRFYPFKTHQGKELILDYTVRNAIYKAIQANKQNLLKNLSEIQGQCFQIQGRLTQHEYVSHESLVHLSEQQINVGFFSSYLKDGLASYLFMQLNQIIHFLLYIPHSINVNDIGIQGYHFRKRAAQQLKKINLVSFNVFDLLRCKCTSGEDEIIYLINFLKQMHYNEKSDFQLVRVKDRLAQGTRDVMINAQFFPGQPAFQIQLSVTSQVDIKQDLLDQYNHFLYELRRSKMLGPLIQNVSIWTTLQQRILYFNELTHTRFETAINKPHQHICSNPKMQVFVGPIVCNTCKTFYHIPRTCLVNQICQTCLEVVCGQCWYLGLQKKQRKRFILGHNIEQSILNNIQQYQNLDDIENFPEYSLFVKKPFLRAQLSFLHHYPTIQGNEGELAQIVYRKAADKVILRGFLTQLDASKKDKISNFIVFGINPSFIQVRSLQEIEAMLEQQPSTKLISVLDEPNYIRDIKTYDNINKKASGEVIQRLKQILQKQNHIDNRFTIYRDKISKVIILGQFQLDRDNIARKLRKRANIQILKRLSNTNCTIISLQRKNVTLQINPQRLIQNIGQKSYQTLCLNLKKLFLNFNQIESVAHLKQMTKLQVLALNNNHLKSLDGIQQLVRLSQLLFDKNHVQSLKPLTNLTKLRILTANCNHISSLQGTQNLVELQRFQIYKNKIKVIKGCTDNWKNLTNLYIRQNSIQEFADSGLQKVQSLSLSKNPIISVKSLLFMTSLTNLSLTGLKLQEIPINSLKGLNLLELSCHDNEIRSLKGISAFKTLKFLGLDNNQIQQLQQLQDIKLEILLLANNKIKVLKGLKNLLDSLQQLTMEGNPLQDCEQLLLAKKCFKLTYSPQLMSQRALQSVKTFQGAYQKVFAHLFVC